MALHQFYTGIIIGCLFTMANELHGTVDAPAPCASTVVWRGDAQSIATKNKQPRSIFVLVPVLLSLDTFPYVSAANLVLLKLYSLVTFLFELVLSPLHFLFEPRPRFMRYNFPHYFPPFLSSLNHVLDSCYTTFPLHLLFEPRPRFMLYTTFPTTFPHSFLLWTTS